MPVPVRDQLIAAITTAVNGEYDPVSTLDELNLPATVVADEADEAVDNENNVYGYSYIEMGITIGKGIIVTQFDLVQLRKEAHDLLAEAITQMFVDTTFGGLADNVEYTGGGILLEPGNRCMAEAQFTVTYHTVRGDPYTIEEA